VSLIDREDAEKTNGNAPVAEELGDQLLFHPRCGLHAAVVNGGTTAHRPNAQSDFNHGVVLTARPLRPDEIFEVVLDQVVMKWAGSIEIGVTTHRPEDLEFPATMTNIRSGTWMMTGNGVMHNGVTILDDYGRSLDRLNTGDRVGVVRRANGVLHFYVKTRVQQLDTFRATCTESWICTAKRLRFPSSTTLRLLLRRIRHLTLRICIRVRRMLRLSSPQLRWRILHTPCRRLLHPVHFTEALAVH